MKCRLFALTLALGALLCFAPSAAALDAPAEVQEEENALPATEEGVPAEVPVLPENPPTMISYTTPEEIGFVWEDSVEPEQPESPPAAGADAHAQAESAASPEPILPQTGTADAAAGALAGSGSALTFFGWFFAHIQRVLTS